MKEIKKEEIENLSYKDITFMILTKEKKGMSTLDLFTKIVNLLELPSSTIENKIADYFTSLTTDKRFILVDGIWDLRSRHTSDKIVVDETEEDEDSEFDETRDDLDIDEYGDEYSDDSNVNLDGDVNSDADYDDSDDDLADLVVLDEEDLNE